MLTAWVTTIYTRLLANKQYFLAKQEFILFKLISIAQYFAETETQNWIIHDSWNAIKFRCIKFWHIW